MKMARRLVTVVALALTLFPMLPARGAGYQMSIAFPAYTNRAEVLTNFPVLVVLSNNVGGSGFSYADQPFLTANGVDLRFRDGANATDLNYEIESWNTNGTSYVWVQVPAIPGDGTGTILAKWGDPAASDQLPCTTNGAVWSGGFRNVYHFSEASGNAADATANRYTATNYNITYGAGTVGNAALIDAETDSYLFAPVSNAVLSASVWYYYSDIGTDNGWNTIFVRDGGGYHHLLIRDSDRHVGCYNSSFVDSTVALSLGSWYYLTVVMNGSSYRLYINGVQVQDATGFDNSATGHQLSRISTFNGSTQGARGKLDEARIENVVRSTNWAWACYLSQGSNAMFNSYGTAHAAAPGSPSIVNVGAVNVDSNRADMVGNLITGDAPVTVTCYWGTNDGGAVASTWMTNLSWSAGAVGYQTNGIAGGLLSGTRYYFRYYATNSVGECWAPGSVVFYTLGAPTVNNADGASAVGVTSATMNGSLLAGTADTYVWIYWGTADGGTTKASWNQTPLAVGQPGIAAFRVGVSGLLTNQTYWYRCYASNTFNGGSEAWAPASASFTTYPMVVLTNDSLVNGGATLLSLPPVTGTAGGVYQFDGPFVMNGHRLTTDNGSGITLNLGGTNNGVSGSSGATNIYTYLSGAVAGSFSILNAGSISLGIVDTHAANKYNCNPSGGNVTFGQATSTGDGPIAGSIRVDAIHAHEASGWNGWGSGGNVTIYGQGDVKVQTAAGLPGDVTTYHGTAIGGSINIQHRGAFVASNLLTGAHTIGNWTSESSGSVALNGSYGGAACGACEVNRIDTSHRFYGGSAGTISIQGYTAVRVGAGGLLSSNDTSGVGGNISIGTVTPITGDITVSGTICATGTTKGVVSLVAGGTITLATLDLSLVKSATLSSGGGTSTITGPLLNFATASSTNGLLDAPPGQTIRYSSRDAGNSYLGGQTYVLKSGGKLKSGLGGTVVLFF